MNNTLQHQRKTAAEFGRKMQIKVTHCINILLCRLSRFNDCTYFC